MKVMMHAGNGMLALIAGTIFGGCCPEENAEVPLVEDVSLVSATADFSLSSGTLDIAVSPKDTDGSFVGQGLPDSAFAFENVTIAPINQLTAVSTVDMAVTQVTVSEPNASAALTAAVIFDSSGSMSGNDPGAAGRRAGGTAFFDILDPTDRVAVLDFGAGRTPPLADSRILQDFTNDRALLDAALDQLQESGGTPLFGSLLEGLELLATQMAEVPAAVVLTDGQASDTSRFGQAIARAQALTIPVYAIGLGAALDFGLLSQLATETAGGFIEAADAAALQQAFAGVSSGVRLGSVVVQGRGMYQLPNGAGRYQVAGRLVTTDGEGRQLVTPFAVTTDIGLAAAGAAGP